MRTRFAAPVRPPAKARPAVAEPSQRAAERRLIASARAGDRKALEQLLQQASGPAYRFSLGFCRDPHEAEDLAQDVMATLLRTLGSFRGDSSLSTWTYTVARRACVRRKKRMAKRALQREASAHEMSPPAVVAGPHRRLEQRRLGEALEQAIASLPADQREVVVFRDVEGLPAADVAAIIGIGERAVKSRLHRARVALRAKLAPFVAGGAAPPPSSGCPDTALSLSRYLEGELSSGVCARMEEHVASCPACAGACTSMRAVLGACRTYGTRPVPPQVRKAVRAAVRELMASRERG